jgi:NAD-dependent deacetylase
VNHLIEASADGVPRCTATECHYPLRPSSTLWGEPLIEQAVRTAWEVATDSDCFMVIDSDLRAVPMSLLPSVPLTRGVPLIMLGEIPTQYDRYASVLVREASEPVLVALADLIASG